MIPSQPVNITRKGTEPGTGKHSSPSTHDAIDHPKIIRVRAMGRLRIISEDSNVPAIARKGAPGRVLGTALDSELIFTGFLVRPAALADPIGVVRGQVNQGASRDDTCTAQVLDDFTRGDLDGLELEVAPSDVQRVERAVVT